MFGPVMTCIRLLGVEAAVVGDVDALHADTLDDRVPAADDLDHVARRRRRGRT